MSGPEFYAAVALGAVLVPAGVLAAWAAACAVFSTDTVLERTATALLGVAVTLINRRRAMRDKRFASTDLRGM